MAQQVTVVLVDDIDGTPAAQSVQFGLDGVAYAIDLSEPHADKLRAFLAEYVEHARRVGGRKRRGSPTIGHAPATTDREQLHAIREWARSKGYDIRDRGRIPAHIREEFEQAHAVPEPAPEPEPIKPASKAKRPATRRASGKTAPRAEFSAAQAG